MQEDQEKSTPGQYREDGDNLSITSDSDFQALPSRVVLDPGSQDGIAFYSQFAHKKSPSAVIDTALALARNTSVRSNGSIDSSTHFQSMFGLAPRAINQAPENVEGVSHGRSDSTASLVDATANCSLVKSLSERSNKSVQSNIAVGTVPFGTLRVHGLSPTRQPKETYECLKHGDVVIIRDVPVGTVFGYDTWSFDIREPGYFEGIKNIGPGAHVVWGGGRGSSLRQGFWLFTPSRKFGEFGDILVKRWDGYNEVLEDEMSVAEDRIQRSSVLEIEDHLHVYTAVNSGPNPPEILKTRPHIWNDLTMYIQPALLHKITGQDFNKWLVSTTHDVQPIENHDLRRVKGTDYRKEVLNFVFPRSRQTFSMEAFGRERTDQALDTTSYVRDIVKSHCTYEEPLEIIGELQFCFLTGMIFGNIACMEQWAYIVKTLFKAFRLSVEMPVFFRTFIQTFHSQLDYDELGFESGILEHEEGLRDDLKILLITFKSRLTELLISKGPQITDQQHEVGKAFEELEARLLKWNWDLRGNYVRSGRVQLEDGEFVEAELSEFEAEDERDYSGKGKGKGRERRHSSRASRSSSSKSGGVSKNF